MATNAESQTLRTEISHNQLPSASAKKLRMTSNTIQKLVREENEVAQECYVLFNTDILKDFIKIVI